MLSLTLRGFAFFGDITWEVPPGFLAITGETGAGKSLLAGGLRFVLGGELPVEGPLDATLVVEDPPEAVKEILRQHELPGETPLILRRIWDETRRRGKVFVQDTPATLRLLRRIGDALVLFHEQQEHLVEDPAKLLDLVDAYAGLSENRQTLRELWQDLVTSRRELQELREKLAEKRLREEVLSHERTLFEELPDPETWEEISRDLSRMEHMEELRGLLEEAGEGLQSGVDALADVLRNLDEAVRLDERLGAIRDELARMVDLLEEQGRDLGRYAEGLGMDEEERMRLEALRERVRGLMLRYHTDYEGLLAVRERLEREWAELEGLEERLQGVEARVRRLEEAYDREASSLSRAREAVLPEIGSQMMDILRRLRLPRAVVQFVREETSPGPLGRDRIRLLFSAHGGDPVDASQASGGERARLALALLVVFSRALSVPVVVLDEIDAAVGGDTAHAVGELLRDLGRDHTVVAITHWPQVAARARVHDRVVKVEEEPVRMRLLRLQGEDRVKEIARMLGNAVDPTLLQAARDLLAQGEVRAG